MTDGSATQQSRWEWIGLIVLAHVEMLFEQGLIDEEAATTLYRGIDSVMAGSGLGGSILHQIIAFDERLDAVTPQGVAGTARVGRGSFDVIATVARMELREPMVELIDRVADLQVAFAELAFSHAVTLMPAYAGGLPAQPTTLGHYLGGLLGPLQRSSQELQHALEHVDQSPMGAVALASTGMPIDRQRAAELLGFARPIINTFDAVSAVDHLQGVAAAVRGVARPIVRFLHELGVWLRTEPTSFLTADDMQSFVPDLPQLRIQSELDRLAGVLMANIDETQSVEERLDAFGYEPIVALEPVLDDLQDSIETLHQGLHDIQRFMLDQVIVNRAYLANRAGRDYTTSSDLADFLMLEEQVDPGAARMIADLVVASIRERGVETSGITVENIDSAALLILGREIGPEFEAISRYLAPRRFVERRQAMGAPSPASTRQWLTDYQHEVEEARAANNSVRRRHQAAIEALMELSRGEEAVQSGG
jgi:argininosuccinate lyase